MGLFRSALAAAPLLIASGVPAHAEEWRHIDQSGAVTVAVDIDSFGGPQSQRTFRSLLIPSAADGGFAYLIVDATVDCQARTISGVKIGAYDGAGSLLREDELPREGEPVGESDGTAAVADAACDGVALTGRSFASVDAFRTWVAEP